MMARLGRWLAPALVPFAAMAADQAIRSIDPGAARFWWVFLAVQVLALVGYAASSLPQWAGWIDTAGGAQAILERRLKIVQGTVIAVLAGNCGYYGGFYYFALPEVLCFGTTAIAAYGGDKVLSPLLSRLTGRVQQGS